MKKPKKGETKQTRSISFNEKYGKPIKDYPSKLFIHDSEKPFKEKLKDKRKGKWIK